MAKKNNTDTFRLPTVEKDELKLASKMSEIPRSEIIRIGALKEAKKILRDIEKGK